MEVHAEWKQEIYFYAPNGQKMGSYQPSVNGGVLSAATLDTNLTFGGRLVRSN